MKVNRPLFFIALIITVIVGLAFKAFKTSPSQPYPLFEDYVVQVSEIIQIGTIPQATVTFDTQKDKEFCSPYLESDTMYDPDFAGRYFVQTIPCGNKCESIVLVDCTTGKVTITDLLAEAGVEYKISSNLLVVNPPVDIISYYKNCSVCSNAPETEYYVMEKGRLHLLKKRSYHFD